MMSLRVTWIKIRLDIKSSNSDNDLFLHFLIRHANKIDIFLGFCRSFFSHGEFSDIACTYLFFVSI